MAKKIETIDQTELTGAPSIPADIPLEPVTSIPGMVKIVNKMAHRFDVTLADGTNLTAGPKGGQNTSRAVLQKLLPPHVRRMRADGQIDIVPA